MRDLVIVVNRLAVSFKEKEMRKLMPPRFVGGLVQAMTGLLKKDSPRKTMLIGSSTESADRRVVMHDEDKFFSDLRAKGIAPEHYPYVEVDEYGREHVEYKDFDFYQLAHFFETSVIEGYYDKLCNEGLWPDLHSTETRFDKVRGSGFPASAFRWIDGHHYMSVCGAVADAIMQQTLRSEKIWQGGDDFVVWIQDYHHMPTSWLYRKMLDDAGLSTHPKIHIGQFMHTPFFNIDVISDLLEDDKEKIILERKNWGSDCQSMEEMLKTLVYRMLGNSFIGFHDFSYCQNFAKVLHVWYPDELTVSEKADHFEISHNMPHKKTIVGAYPIGIDVDRILPEVKLDKRLEYSIDEIDLEQLIEHDKTKNTVVFGGVERLDYTKGIPARIEIFRHLLPKLRNDGLEGRLIQIAEKSRWQTEPYRKLDAIVRSRVYRTNKEFQTDDFKPVMYTLEGIGQPQNYRFMRDVDVLLVTTLEDGMNIVVLEGILSKKYLPPKERGIIVLGNSGAARRLRSAGFRPEDGIVYIDPLNPKEAADRIYNAMKQGYFITDRLVEYVENNCRVDDWAEKNTTSIIKKVYPA